MITFNVSDVNWIWVIYSLLSGMCMFMKLCMCGDNETTPCFQCFFSLWSLSNKNVWDVCSHKQTLPPLIYFGMSFCVCVLQIFTKRAKHLYYWDFRWPGNIDDDDDNNGSYKIGMEWNGIWTFIKNNLFILCCVCVSVWIWVLKAQVISYQIVRNIHISIHIKYITGYWE